MEEEEEESEELKKSSSVCLFLLLVLRLAAYKSIAPHNYDSIITVTMCITQLSVAAALNYPSPCTYTL